MMCIIYALYVYCVCIMYVLYIYYEYINIYYMIYVYIYIYYVLCIMYYNLRIQGGNFLKNALNRVLIPAQECRGKTVQNRTGIMDLQNKSIILVAKQ